MTSPAFPLDNLPDGFKVSGILVPNYRLSASSAPRGCKLPGQKWSAPFSQMCMTEDETKIIVYPESFSLDDNLDEDDDDDDDDDDNIDQIGWRKEQSELLQSIEPRPHPNIQQYHGVNENGFPIYEFTNGLLFFFLDMHHEFEITDSLRYRWAWQLLSALKFLHERQLVHNRIGSNSLWLKKDLSLLLCDVGNLSRIGENFLETYNRDPEAPDENCYMIVKGTGIDELTGSPIVDIFAFASMFYFILAKKSPFKTSIQPHEQYERPRYLAEIENEGARKIIGQCWDQEYEDVLSIIHDFRKVMEDIGLTFDESDNIVLDAEITEIISKFQSTL